MRVVLSPTPEELERLAALCGELSFDDEIDPRRDRRGSSRKKAERKAYQLCRQVDETISLVLAGADDPALRELSVARVEPARGASHLRVWITAHPPLPGEDPVDPAAALESVERAAGILRAEVAQAITRRRAPELSYRFLPPEGSNP